MPQIINTNIASLTAQRNLNTSQSANSTALERLSSGLRINSAKDDAAGLAISTKFESQTKGLNVAIRNAGDGISLAQTAEGALGAMTDNLQRVRELAVQSSNATNSDDDRVALQKEVSQLMSEIGRIAEETNFNGKQLLDGSFNGTFQVGANAGNTIDVNIAELTVDKLGSSAASGISAIGSKEALANGDLSINGTDIVASKAESDTSSTNLNSSSAIAKVAAINEVSDETGVSAMVNENVVAGTVMDADAMEGTISLNGVEIKIQTTDDASTSRASVAQSINAVSDQTGIVATDSGDDNGGVTLTAKDGQNITIGVDITNDTDEGGFNTDGDTVNASAAQVAAATGLAIGGSYDSFENNDATDNTFTVDAGVEDSATSTEQADLGTYVGGYTLIAEAGTKEIDITGGNDTGRGDIANSGLTAGTFSKGEAALVSTSQTQSFTESSLANGEIAADKLGAAAEVLTAAVGYDITVDGTSVASDAFVGTETIAEAASALNGLTDDAIIFESVNMDISAVGGTLATTDVFAIADDAANGTNTYTGFTSLAELADAINDSSSSTASIASGFEMSAELNAAGDTISLSINNFSTDSVSIAQTTATTAVTALVEDAAVAETLGAAAIANGRLAVTSTDNKEVNITLTDPTKAQTALADFTSGSATLTASPTVNGLEDGDLQINGVNIKAPTGNEDSASSTTASDGVSRIQSSDKSLSAISVAASINAVADETGVSAEAEATVVTGGDGTGTITAFEEGDQAGLYINGVDIGTVTLQNNSSGSLDADKARTDTITAINQKAGETGVTAEDNGVSITLTAADGRNVSVAIDDKSGNSASIGAVLGLDSADNADGTSNGIGESTFGIGDVSQGTTAESRTYETTYGSVKLSSASEIEVNIGSNGKDELSALGLKTGSYGGGEDGTFLKDVDVSTFEGAQAAITAVDNALNTVSGQRADLGAIQNRFDSTVSNLSITSENLTAANSRIRDADFAAESAELSRTQVLQQAGVSILAQANQRGQSVLSLLG